MLGKNHLNLKLFPESAFCCSGVDDPLPYYYKPLIGSLYRYRIEQGLSLLFPPYENVLEFGYGSGLLLPTLAEISTNLCGVDISSDPFLIGKCLEEINVTAKLYQDDLLNLSFPNDTFDLIVAFSVFEHINDCERITKEIHRILKPSGELLVGMPRVDKKMTKLFKLIGYNQIELHHVTSKEEFLKACKDNFVLEKESRIFPFLPSFMSLYFNMLFKKNDNLQDALNDNKF